MKALVLVYMPEGDTSFEVVGVFQGPDQNALMEAEMRRIATDKAEDFLLEDLAAPEDEGFQEELDAEIERIMSEDFYIEEGVTVHG